MAKTQEELNALKEEVKKLNDKLAIKELNDKELENISGGMISFEPLRKTMKKKGISTYTLQEQYGFNPADISRLKYNHNYIMKMVDRLCKILNCSPSDVINFVDDDNDNAF